MALQGAAAPRQALVEVLLTLGRLGRTGILTIQSQNEIVGLSFLEGQIVSADALNESLEEGLGEVLASRGLVEPEAFADLVAEYEAGGGRVSDLLVERNFVDRRQLLEVLRWHYYLLCRIALSWDRSEYKFYEGSEVTHEHGVRPLPVEELLVRAADDLGREGPLPGVIPAAGAVYQRTATEGVAAGHDELLLGLATGDTDGAHALLREMDGRIKLEDLAARAGMSEFEMRLTVYLLERAGQVREADHDTAEFLPVGGSRAVAGARASMAGVGGRWQGLAELSKGWSEKLNFGEMEWLSWSPRLLAAGLVLLLTWTVSAEPGRLLLPFPWQEGLRQAVLDEQTSAAYLKIDRAAKTAFLLDGHFPTALETLVQDGSLVANDLEDPAGRRLGYAAQVAGYLIYPLDEGEPAPGASRTEAVTGNFLLDPEFVPGRAVAEPPLVLLD